MSIVSSHAAKPFRFGVNPRLTDGAGWRDTARKAEDLGYDTLFLSDHFGDAWNPLVPMTVAAEATTTLHVGALVFDNDFRHPLVLARDVAALDVLSSGRVELGLGAGWRTSDYTQSGIAFDRPGVRIARMEEALECLRLLWSNDSATFSGEHYTLTEAVCRPKPTTPGGPTLIIGGGGKRVLGVAARYADVIGLNVELGDGVGGVEAAKTGVAERYLERVGWIRDAAGERFEDLELQILCQFEQVTPDRDALYDAVAPMFGLSPEVARKVPNVLAGSVEQIIDDLQERRAELGISYVVVHELEALAPVVAALAGN